MSRHYYVYALLLLAACLAPDAMGQATNIAIVAGNGQLICTSCSASSGHLLPAFDPLIVRVTDASGNPVANALITWNVVAGNANLAQGTQTFTQNDGTSQLLLPIAAGGFGGFGHAYDQNTVTATLQNSAAVTFYETQSYGDPQTLAPLIQTRVSPSPGDAAAISGTPGSQSSQKFTVNVFSSFSNVPNISVRLTSNNTDPTTGPIITCLTGPNADPGATMTDASGTGICTPVFGGQPGSGQFFVLIGGVANSLITGSGPVWYDRYGPFGYTVVPGSPGAIVITSGDPRSGTAGQSVILSAKVTDASGVALANQFVTWSVTSGSATLANGSTTTDGSGITSNTATLSSTATGAIKVKATVANSSLSVTFTINASIPVNVTGIQIVSGNNQSAALNAAFGQPLVVQVNGSNGSPVSGATVTFSATGPATLSSTSATTGTDGKAQVTATAGATAGAASVTASAGSFSQTFSLTVTPPAPPITANSFYNGASFAQGSLSPCGIATILATGLAPGLQGAVTGGLFGPLPYQLANDKVTVNNVNAPLYNVANLNGQEQLTFQMPCETTGGTTVAIVVTTAGGGSLSVNVPVQVVAPGIFQTTSSDNVVRAVAVRPDGSFVTIENPARRGEVIRVFATGLGATLPAVGTNAIAVTGVDSLVQGTVVAGITNQAGQGEGLRVTGARAAPDLIGIYEVPVQIPNDSATGNNVSFSLAVIPVGSSNPIYSQTVKLPVL